MITSADGRVVWVTARASDALLGSSALLVTNFVSGQVELVNVAGLP